MKSREFRIKQEIPLKGFIAKLQNQQRIHSIISTATPGITVENMHYVRPWIRSTLFLHQLSKFFPGSNQLQHLRKL